MKHITSALKEEIKQKQDGKQSAKQRSVRSRKKRIAQIEEHCKKAISIMLSTGVLENSTLDGCSIINYIARKFGVAIPIKVQGWINKSLVSVEFKGGFPMGYSYRGNTSKTFLKYLGKLTETVKDAEQVVA